MDELGILSDIGRDQQFKSDCTMCIYNIYRATNQYRQYHC